MFQARHLRGIFSCGKCDASFSDLDQLHSHLQRHEMDPPRGHVTDNMAAARQRHVYQPSTAPPQQDYHDNTLHIDTAAPSPQHSTPRKKKNKTTKRKSDKTSEAASGVISGTKCPFCAETFSQEFVLEKHVKRAHFKELKFAKHFMFGETGDDDGGSEGNLAAAALPYAQESASSSDDNDDDMDAQAEVTFPTPETAPAKISGQFCVETFATQDQLDVHLSRFHRGPDPFCCDLCTARFPNKTKLNQHRRGHRKRFSCGRCDKVRGANLNPSFLPSFFLSFFLSYFLPSFLGFLFRDGWLGLSAFMLTKHTCLYRGQ